MSGAQILSLVVLLACTAWASVTDLRSRRIPNEAVVILSLAGLTSAWAAPLLVNGVLDALLGAMLVIALLEGISLMTTWLTGGRGLLGGGDVKLGGALGFWLGWGAVPVFILAASLLFILQNLFFPAQRVGAPFGPSLSIAACGVLLISLGL